MKNILDHHDVYYVYSKVWLDDLCVWTQAYARSVECHNFIKSTDLFCSDDVLTRFGTLVKNASITRESIGWDLDQLEAVVMQQLHEGEQREVDSDDE